MYDSCPSIPTSHLSKPDITYHPSSFQMYLLLSIKRSRTTSVMICHYFHLNILAHRFMSFQNFFGPVHTVLAVRISRPRYRLLGFNHSIDTGQYDASNVMQATQGMFRTLIAHDRSLVVPQASLFVTLRNATRFLKCFAD